MLFRHLFLATLLANAGRPRIIDEADALGHTEVPLSQEPLGKPFTISVQATATGSRPADLVKITMLVFSAGNTKQEAATALKEDTKQLEDFLQASFLQHNDPLTSSVTMQGRPWAYSCKQVKTLNYPREMYEQLVQFCTAASDDLLIVLVHYSLVLHRPERIDDLAWDLSRIANVGFARPIWHLTEETRAELRAELQSKVVKELMDKGKDYAAAFGTELGAPMELQHFHEYPPQTRFTQITLPMWPGEVSFDVPEMNMELSLSCKFG